MIDTIFWDIDGTLMDFKKSEHESIKKALSEVGFNATEEDIKLYSKINDSCWKKYEKKEYTREEVFAKRFELFFAEYGFKADIKALNDNYLIYLGTYYFLYDDTLMVTSKLKENYKQYAVTNGHTKPQTMKLCDSGLSDIFDGVFISGSIGHPKPEKEFFDYCFNEIGEEKRKSTIIIGDSLTSDIKGGENAGILTCWYNPNGEENTLGVKVDFEIKELKEIFEVLKKVG